MFEHEQSLGLCPRGKEVEITRFHPIYGGTMIIPNDVGEYGFQPRQKFVPHVIEDKTHPAKVGDIVTLDSWLARRLGMSVAFVSGVRTIKAEKKSNGNRQVELLGLPCQWFSIGHIEEYKGQQIYSHLWGNAFNLLPCEGLIAEEIKPKAQTRVILPNL